jgi:hypothetical protein
MLTPDGEGPGKYDLVSCPENNLQNIDSQKLPLPTGLTINYKFLSYGYASYYFPLPSGERVRVRGATLGK